MYIKDHSRVRMPVNSDMTDEQVREVAWNFDGNGSYSTDICRKCGSYLCMLDGDSKKAKIHESCNNCIEGIM